jgi:hypothetical protein
LLNKKKEKVENQDPGISTKVTGETGDLVGEIWLYYDDDGSGTLAKEEIQEYIEEATGMESFP